MKFEEALKLYREGKAIKRAASSDEYRPIDAREGSTLTMDDILCTDWMVASAPGASDFDIDGAEDKT